MKIVEYPHPALRHPVKPLTGLDKQVHLQIGRMLELMYQAGGLGLAANQVVLPYQVFVMNHSIGEERDRSMELVCINPVITERKGTVEAEEGCLSFPGIYQNVKRSKHVVMQAYNLKGELFEVRGSDLVSRIIQHETDHLHGILYIDKFGMVAKMAVRGNIREMEEEFAKAQQKGSVLSMEALKAALERGDVPEIP